MKPQTAIDFIIWLEDLTGSGVITTDAGGRTRWGISERAHPEAWQNGPPTRGLAENIYLVHYWEPCRCDELPGGLDLMVCDSAVQHGQHQAIELLQESVGAYPDGAFGPKTLAAAQGAGPRKALCEYMARRAVYYSHLRNYERNELGWMRRLAKVFARGLEVV